MNTKDKQSKSPRRPITKEVFPHDLERKKMKGTLAKRPTTSGTVKRNKDIKDGSTVFMAKGTTVKGTPKTRSTKKAGLKAKENFSTNRPKSRLISKSSKMKVKTDRQLMKLHKKSATIIQTWWRKILNERNQLRQKFILAKAALQDLKNKRFEDLQKKESPEKTQINELLEAKEKNIQLNHGSSDEKSNPDVLETA